MARAGDGAGLTETGLVAPGLVVGAHAATDRDAGGLVGLEVSILPFGGPSCWRADAGAPPPPLPPACARSHVWLWGVHLGAAVELTGERGRGWIDVVRRRRARGDLFPAVALGLGLDAAVGGEAGVGGHVSLRYEAMLIEPFIQSGWNSADGATVVAGVAVAKWPLPLL